MTEPMPAFVSRRKLIRVTTIAASLRSLLPGQLRYLSARFEVVAVADGPEVLSQVREREGVRTVCVPMRRTIAPLHDLASLFRLIRLFRRERPDIVHANTPKGSLLAMLAAFFCRVPARVYTVTGLRFETASGLFRRLLIAMERLTCLCATRVVPEGEGVRLTLLREQITRKPLRVIHNGNINGVDLAWYDRSSDVEALIDSFGLRSPAFTFSFVGRLVPDKGVVELIDAFVRLSDLFPGSLRLLLVGPADPADPLPRDTAARIAARSDIVAPGYCPDVRPFMAASAVLLLPSYREGFPNAPMQAGALGVPVIVSDVSGCNEIVTHGCNGLIVPPRDAESLFRAMRLLYEDSSLRSRLASQARPMIASRYDREQLWSAISRFYDSL